MNHRTFVLGLSAALLVIASASQSVFAQMTPGVGYQASLSTISHNVSGTVTILDADTLLVENFTYDGMGPSVFFRLGTSVSQLEYGLDLGTDLVGTAFDGTEGSFTIDLPAGTTVEGFNAVSVWCVPFEAAFGEGTFSAPAPILGDVNSDGTVSFADIPAFIQALISGEFQVEADLNEDSAVTFADIPPFIEVLISQS